jgi:hypothetical protein
MHRRPPVVTWRTSNTLRPCDLRAGYTAWLRGWEFRRRSGQWAAHSVQARWPLS